MDSPSIKATAISVAVGLVAGLIIFGAGFWQGQRKVSTTVVQSETQASEAHGAADELKLRAILADAEIEAKDKMLSDARADVAKKTAELQTLRMASYASTGTPARAPREAPVVPIDIAPIDLSIERKQDEVIATQAVLINTMDGKIRTLTLSRDAWKSSSDARERECLNLRAALAAQEGLTRGALWRGRLQGLALGIGAGFAGGRHR